MSSALDRAAIGSVATALVALAACKEPAPDPSRAAPSGSATTAAAADTSHAPAAPGSTVTAAGPTVIQRAPSTIVMDEPRIDLPHRESFRLLDAGRAPRSALRYALAAGSTAVTARTTLSSRHIEKGQFSAPVAMPAIRDGFAITVAADHTGRLALVGLPGEAATSTADTTAYLAAWRAQLQDRHIAVTFDARGELSAIVFDDDPAGARSQQARDELVQRLLATIVPLPIEPVGTGASWRVVTILRQGPAYAKQTATYTLTSRRPSAWRLHVKLLRVGEEQPLADPALPRGTTATLLALFRSLEGDLDLDAAHPLITGGSLAIESRMHVRLQDAGQPPTEQMFEDTGSVAFSLCQPVVHPAPTPRATHEPLAACPAGFSPRR
jgi:hypothetical protein